MQTTTLLSNQTTSPERFHALDAARAIALFIGIFHHGIESFVWYAKWDWITQDSQGSLLLDILFYITHVFRMQAFFLMSGFFVHLLISRLGILAFLSNRVKRLVLPFILFWPVLYYSTYHLWVWGIQYLKHCSYAAAISKLPDYMVFSKGFPLMHLWFLYFLILFCAGVIICRPLINQIIDRRGILRGRFDKFLLHFSNRWWGSLIIGLFMGAPMLGMTDGFGVDTSASGLTPRVAPFFLYGMYFTLGWFIFRQTFILKNIERFRLPNLLMSLLLIMVLIVLSLVFADASSPGAAFVKIVLNVLYAFASITAVFAFIGYMMAYFSKPSHQIRYLSDASYWGYLIHLPLIGFFQILVAPYDLFWAVKLILIFTPTILILTVTYRYVVRDTVVGILLNGEKKSKKLKILLQDG